MTDSEAPKVQRLDLAAIEKRLRTGFAFAPFRKLGLELVAALQAEHAARVDAERRATVASNRSNVFRDEARRLAEDLKRYTLPPEVVTVLAREAAIGYEGLRDSATPYERESTDTAAELGEIATSLHELRTRYHLETPDADLVYVTGSAGTIADLHAKIEKLEREVETAHEHARTLELEADAVRRALPDFDTFPSPEHLELLAAVVEGSDAVDFVDGPTRTELADGLEALASWIDDMTKEPDDG